MVDWMSTEELLKDAKIFGNLMHVCLGIYVWEFAVSLSFDWDFLSRRKTFRWPLCFYFLGRYCLLFALFGIVVSLNVVKEVNCQALYLFNQLMGNISIGSASINLSIRTIAVWSQSKYITAALVIVILGHWALVLQAVVVKAAWVDGQGCVVVSANDKVLTALFLYTMSFDFIVMCLMAYKLGFQGKGRQSRLVKLIFHDGLLFYVIAFFANALATTFIMLKLNPIMSAIFDVPAAVACTIVASRAVRRLTKFTSTGAEVFSGQNNTAGGYRGPSTLAFRPTGSKKNDGVHVQMDTFTVAETQVNADSFFDDTTMKAKRLDDTEAQPELDYKNPSAY